MGLNSRWWELSLIETQPSQRALGAQSRELACHCVWRQKSTSFKWTNKLYPNKCAWRREEKEAIVTFKGKHASICPSCIRFHSNSIKKPPRSEEDGQVPTSNSLCWGCFEEWLVSMALDDDWHSSFRLTGRVLDLSHSCGWRFLALRPAKEIVVGLSRQIQAGPRQLLKWFLGNKGMAQKCSISKESPSPSSLLYTQLTAFENAPTHWLRSSLAFVSSYALTSFPLCSKGIQWWRHQPWSSHSPASLHSFRLSFLSCKLREMIKPAQPISQVCVVRMKWDHLSESVLQILSCDYADEYYQHYVHWLIWAQRPREQVQVESGDNFQEISHKGRGDVLIKMYLPF